jgi:ribulose-phosphate 3-epimerase
MPLDVHLMIDNAVEQIDWYLDAGADVLTVHIECFGEPSGAAKAQGSSVSIEHIDKPAELIAALEHIRERGARAGLSLNPGTPAALLEPFYAYLDWVLVMSVHPGFAAQSFIEGALGKIAEIKVSATRKAANALIAVDGGINLKTAATAAAAGADVLIAGNAVFAQENPAAQIELLRQK